MLESISILAYRGKAYLPTHLQLGDGTLIPTSPVIITDLTRDSILAAIQELAAAGHPPGPNTLTREFWKTHKEPLQIATRAKSQRQLDREGLHYTIVWEPDKSFAHCRNRIQQIGSMIRTEYKRHYRLMLVSSGLLMTFWHISKHMQYSSAAHVSAVRRGYMLFAVSNWLQHRHQYM
jgi:hypothetical protein